MCIQPCQKYKQNPSKCTFLFKSTLTHNYHYQALNKNPLVLFILCPVLIVDWSLFEQNQQSDFDEVELPYSTLTENPEFPDNANSGTILQFTNLRTQWTKGAILKLRRSLEKMINPFAEQTDFQIEIVAPQYQEEDKAILQEINSLELFDKTEKQLEEQARQRLKLINGPIENRIKTILSIKTTQIESRIVGDTITTTLTDRGTLMYKIQETNKFSHLQNASMILYYLNRAAKHNFTLNMGVDAVNYGNLFLFRNNFRIYPYGEYNDDSWGFNKRTQQGRARTLGTRSILGRVDVQTDNVEDFKEVSSRDGGLVRTEASDELFEYVSHIHRLLERYVVGVLWGVNFIQNEYFITDEVGIEERKRVQFEEKQSENTEHIYESIGSRLDFIQLIRGLANNSTVQVLEYNKDLANIVEDQKKLENLKVSFIDELRKMAGKTNDTDLLNRINTFEQELEKLKKQKEEAEKKHKEEQQKRKEAEKHAAEEEQKRKDEEQKRKKVEKEKKETEIELEHEKKQGIFQRSIIGREKEQILGLQHQINHSSGRIKLNIKNMLEYTNSHAIKLDEQIQKYISIISLEATKIESISRFVTNANFDLKASEITQDIGLFIEDYINEIYLPETPVLYTPIKIRIKNMLNGCLLSFRPLEITTLIDNFVQNAVKAEATKIQFELAIVDGKIQILITNDGKEIPQNHVDRIYELGFTTTDGSGIGLFNVKTIVKRLKGSIALVSNTPNNVTFQIII